MRVHVRARARSRVRISTHRQRGQLEALRGDLSRAVDLTAGGGKIELKDVLKRIAGKGLVAGTYGACLKEAMERGGDVIGAYKACQKQFNLAADYRDVWGVPS